MSGGYDVRGVGWRGGCSDIWIVVTMTITLGKFPCTMQNNEKNAEKRNLTPYKRQGSGQVIF